MDINFEHVSIIDKKISSFARARDVHGGATAAAAAAAPPPLRR